MKIKVAHLRDFMNQWDRGEISFSKMVHLLNEVAKDKWISVNDRLPELDVNVLGYWENRGAEIINICICENHICVTDNEHYPILLSGSGLTHWMPLPEPPQE